MTQAERVFGLGNGLGNLPVASHLLVDDLHDPVHEQVIGLIRLGGGELVTPLKGRTRELLDQVHRVDRRELSRGLPQQNQGLRDHEIVRVDLDIVEEVGRQILPRRPSCFELRVGVVVLLDDLVHHGLEGRMVMREHTTNLVKRSRETEQLTHEVFFRRMNRHAQVSNLLRKRSHQ